MKVKKVILVIIYIIVVGSEKIGIFYDQKNMLTYGVCWESV